MVVALFQLFPNIFFETSIYFLWHRRLCHPDPDLSWTHLYVRNSIEQRKS